VHGVFAPGARDALLAAGAARVVTTNTIPDQTNAIDVAGPLGEAVRSLMAEGGPA
jgi:ribose-phosphate pyrophosphokinase